MGFADLCLSLKITYGSPASIDLMDEVMGFIRREVVDTPASESELRRGRFRSLSRTAKPTKTFSTTRSASPVMFR